QVLTAGRVGVEAGALPDDADRLADALRVAGDVDPGHTRLAAVGTRECGQDPHRRRLTGPVGTEQAEDRSALDLEAEAVEGLDAALVCLPQVRCFDRVHVVTPCSWIYFDERIFLLQKYSNVKTFESRTDRGIHRSRARVADRDRAARPLRRRVPRSR